MLEFEIYELFKRYGILTPHYKVFDIDQEFFFDRFPAVLKIASDKILHKSDVGGVRTGIHSNEELQSAKREIINNLQTNGIFLDMNDKFIVVEEVHGVEFFIGGVFDEVFEEVLLFGKGGTMVEIEQDICYIDTLADEDEIERSFFTTKISRIFPTFRGKEYNLTYIIQTIQKFQKLFMNEDIIAFDVNPLVYTPKGLVSVDARVIKGKKSKKRQKISRDIFDIHSVAIIGVSDNPQKVGYALAKNALQSSLPIYFVNPHLTTLFDRKVYHSIQELPPIDTAVIATPAKAVIPLIEELAHKGVKNVIVISAGFKESGNEEAQEELKKLAQTYGLTVLGPNCLGVFDVQKSLNLTFASSSIPAGEIALISQSGAVLTALIDKASSYALGFSQIVSLGNMVDFDFADAIKALQTKSCTSINIYAEGLQDGKAYLDAIRQSTKPIALYKSAKTQEAKEAAQTHTGNIATDYDMLTKLSYAAGATIKRDIDELLFASAYASKQEALIVTNAGGPGAILSDILVLHGKKLSSLSLATVEELNQFLPPSWSKRNPIDILGDATSKRYKRVLDIVYDKSKLLFVLVTPQFMTDGTNIAKVILEYEDAIPVFFGERNFQEAFRLFRQHKRVYFNDLENVANIL